MALQVKKRYPISRSARPSETLPQRLQRREQRRRTIHRSTTTGLVLMLITLATGIAYTWYSGQQKTALLTQAPAKITPASMFKAPKVASNAKIGAAIQLAPSSAKSGENASITIRTNPDANCTITVKYNKVLASDSGLAPKLADEFGVASWSWTVAQNAPIGKWPVEVTCKNKVYSAVVIGYLTVER